MIEQINNYMNSVNEGYIFLVMFSLGLAFLLFAANYESKELKEALDKLEKEKLQTSAD